MLDGLLGGTASWTAVILGVGMLIFIHEAGHFLVAKWSGVRVLAFSLGFGPVLWGFQRGDTHYRISWIPLGGYVKMSGENELPEGGYAPDDFPAKSIGVRALIIAAGVIMNAVLGLGLFAAALLVGVTLDAPAVGSVVPGSPAWRAGLLPGDVVETADGHELLEFTDLATAVAVGDPLELGVRRGNRLMSIIVTPEDNAERGYSSIGVEPDPGETLEIEDGSAASLAGFRTGDVVETVEGVPTTTGRFILMIRRFTPLSGPARVRVRGADGVSRTVELTIPGTKRRTGIAPLMEFVAAVRPGGIAERTGWMAGDRPVQVDGVSVRGLWSFEQALLQPKRTTGKGSVRVLRDGRVVALTIAPPGNVPARAALLHDLHFGESELKSAIEVLNPGPPTSSDPAPPSPATAVGLRTGDRLLTIDGHPVVNYADILDRIQKTEKSHLTVGWGRGDEKFEGEIMMAEYPDPTTIELDGLGVEGRTTRITDPGLLLTAAFDRCIGTTRNIFATIGGIFSGSIAGKNLGGPILIAQVTRQSVDRGVGRYLWILAILSINLMVLNSLPIPVLDGGQLAFIAVEAVTGKPPSEHIVIIAQWAGLLLLLGLMIFTTWNDIARFFGA